MGTELILILLALVAGTWPLWRTDRRHRRMHAFMFGLVLAATVLGVVALGLVSETQPTPAIDPQVVQENDYVSSDTCLSCHPYQHATWHASYHRSMTQTASRESVLAPFDGKELELEGMIWRPERRGSEFWVTGRTTSATLHDPPSFAARVVMTTGSHNYQLYWLEAQDESGMSQFPIVWLIQERMWIPRKSRFLMPPREKTPSETGRWKAHCIKCHATYGRKADASSGETRVAELGISCEACHGPGADHVKRYRSPLRRYVAHVSHDPAPAVINPSLLAHDRSTEVCGQCHSLEIFLTDEKAQDWFRHGTHYRPGNVLSNHQTTVVGRYEDNPPAVRAYLDSRPAFLLPNCFWPDGILRVAGREYNGMLETPCYQRGHMSCLSCHRMHPSPDDTRPWPSWAEDQLSPGMREDQACLQCHAGFQDQEKRLAHTHHQADSDGSRCYNCHMSHTTWGLLRAIRTHTVDSPSVATSVATGRPNACNQCHLDRTLQWTSEHLQDWYDIEPVDLTEDQTTVAASVLWALRGDAVQRALMAWSMGWPPARQASGTDWMVPYLAVLLKDPYDAIRFRARRSLGHYPAFAKRTKSIDVASTAAEDQQLSETILMEWLQSLPASAEVNAPHLLIRSDGNLDLERINGFLSQRDDRDLYISE